MSKPSTASDKPQKHDSVQGGTLSRLHQIVVVGGGIAGLEIASKLPESIRRTSIAVTLSAALFTVYLGAQFAIRLLAPQASK